MPEPGADAAVEGGCLCGAVRYRLDGAPLRTGYCHCSMCRKASGAPVVAAAVMPAEALTLLQGEEALRRYQSSEEVDRVFCMHCGGHLFFDEFDQPATIDVWLGSLDEPARFAPNFHIYTADRVDWLHIDDDLPRHEQGRPS